MRIQAFSLLFLAMNLTCCNPPEKPGRETISLEGTWAFRMDPSDRGIDARWYLEDLEGVLTLPGSMTENGLGNDVDLATPWTGGLNDSSYFKDERYQRYRTPGNIKIPFWLQPEKYYTGAAWYQKEIRLPENWQGERILLILERCHWESRVFINDSEAGARNSLSVPHRYDIGSLLVPGRNRITIRVDNRMIIPVGINSHSVSDHTQTNWNGITGKIQMEKRGAVEVKSMQIYPDIHQHAARVLISLKNFTASAYQGSLELNAISFNSGEPHRPQGLVQSISISGEEEVVEILFPMGEECRFWSEFSPSLYRLEVILRDANGREADRLLETFGMREFKVDGTRFAVNGQAIFLRGTLECAVFPKTAYPPTDEESWTHLFGRIREHGMNHVRFHSWCPPEAAFEAADKLGFYLQVECGSWANQGSSIGDGSTLDSFIYREGDRILEEYGNHPSFCMLAYGNEPAGKNQESYLGALLEYWKSKDSRRVYTAAAGWPLIPENQYHNSPEPRIQHWGEGLESIINGEPPQSAYDFREDIAPYDIPFVSHEIGQWCVYPDFREISRYTGVMKAKNFEIFRETLEENHMGHLSQDFLMASGKLQALCYKADIEAALRTPGFAGFQMLQLNDFPGQGTALVGILDPFYNSKGYISPESFRHFCDQTVPLARLDRRIFTNSETLSAEIELAHFGASPLSGQTIRCRILNSGNDILFEKEMILDRVPIDNAIKVGTVEFDLKGIEKAQKLKLEVSLDKTPHVNSWDIWVYPEKVRAEPRDVYITEQLDEKSLESLARGKSVLLLTKGHVNEASGARVKIGFSSIFWNTSWTRGQAPHTLGILCPPEHPVFEHFPTEFHSNWQWWEPISRSQAMILDRFPGALEVLVQAIDTWFENRRLALLFEGRVDQGKLMVCSIDLKNDLETNPVSRQLLKSILDYMNSPAFDPETELDVNLIRDLMN